MPLPPSPIYVRIQFGYKGKKVGTVCAKVPVKFGRPDEHVMTNLVRDLYDGLTHCAENAADGLPVPDHYPDLK